MVRTFLKVYGAWLIYFMFLQEQIKDIFIIPFWPISKQAPPLFLWVTKKKGEIRSV
jgi:hypothetical protein